MRRGQSWTTTPGHTAYEPMSAEDLAYWKARAADARAERINTSLRRAISRSSVRVRTAALEETMRRTEVSE